MSGFTYDFGEWMYGNTRVTTVVLLILLVILVTGGIYALYRKITSTDTDE